MSEIKKPKPTIENLKVYESMMKEFTECTSNDECFVLSLGNKALDYQDQFDWFCTFYEENSAVGVKDALGNVVIPAIYEDILNLPVYEYIEEIPFIAQKDGLLGLVRVQGGVAREITGFEYDDVYAVEFTHYTAVRKTGSDKWGLVDFEGNSVIPAEMDSICSSSVNGHIYVSKDGKEGVYDYVLDAFAYPEYDSIDGMGEGKDLTFVKNGVTGHVDVNGKFYDLETLNRFYEGEMYDADGNLIFEGDGEPELIYDHLD